MRKGVRELWAKDAIGRPGKRKREARRSVYSQYVKTFIKVNMIEGG